MFKAASSSKRRVFMAIVAVLAAIALAATAVGGWQAAPAWAASDGPSVSVTRAATGKLVMKKGATYKLGAKASAGKLAYTSSKPNVVSVSKKGVLTAKKAGKATITVKAKSAGKTTTKKVKVTVVKKSKFKKVKKITAKVSATSLAVGKTAKVSVTFSPKKASNKNVIYKSSAPAVASVSAAGKVTAKRAGTAKITVTSCDNKKAKASVTVKVTKPASTPTEPAEPQEPTGQYELNTKTLELEAGTTSQLQVAATSPDPNDEVVEWSTSDATIADVDATGLVYAQNAGLATITATTASGETADCEVYVCMAGTIKYEEFIAQALELTKSSDAELDLTQATDDDSFFLRRLLVQDDGTQLDYEVDYGAVATVRSDEGFNVVQFATSEAAETAFSSLQENEHVVCVEPDAYVLSAGATDDEDPGLSEECIRHLEQNGGFHSWGVKSMHADVFANSLKGTKDSVVVAVLDSGITANHPLFSGRIAKGGYDFVNFDDDPADDQTMHREIRHGEIVILETDEYHGTHVSGTIAECTQGLNVKILPVKVLDEYCRCSVLQTYMGVKYAAMRGARVINMSLDGKNSMEHALWRLAITSAIEQGVTVVVAAGNDSEDTAAHSPANISEAIVVGAIDESKEQAKFSNHGSTLDVVAPGVDICSATPEGLYHKLSGTSMAAPHISAAAAMVKLSHPDYSPAEIEAEIQGCADDLGDPGWDELYGYGLPNLSALASAPEIADVAAQSAIEDYTWLQLESISKAIAAANSDEEGLSIAKAYNLVDEDGKLKGDTKAITMADGVEAQVRILGFRHDDLTSGGKAGITFEFADIPYTHVANPSDTNEGGWASSPLRTWLNDGFYCRLPADLRCRIAEVSKRTNNTGGLVGADTSVVTPTDEKVWLLSLSEVYGDLTLTQSTHMQQHHPVYEAEGTQYKLYADQGVTVESYSFCKKAESNSWWWLRSPYANLGMAFLCVNPDGGYNSVNAKDDYGVSPAFCF